MDVTTERQDSVLSAQVGGRIDGSNVAEFEEAIRTAIEESDRAVHVNGGAKLVHPGGAKLVHLTLCGTRCWEGARRWIQTDDSEPSVQRLGQR